MKRRRCEHGVWRRGQTVPCGRPDTSMWVDTSGREHYACFVHRAGLEHRYPALRKEATIV